MNVTDITLIGSGIASTVTLVEVVGGLLNNVPGSKKTTITVVEKYHEFWKGIPYGSRSSVNALTITSVHDFINELEHPVFFAWLKANIDTWVPWYRERGGITAARWLENNLPLIEKNEWETVYIPRFLFGNYLEQKLGTLIKAAEEKQLLDMNLVHAEAIDVKLKDGLYEITLEYPDTGVKTITSRKLVISAGSAPVRTMCDLTGSKAAYVNDMYEPSVSKNINTLKAALSDTAGSGNKNILIIGSNASSIELLYLLEGMPDMRQLIDKIVIISPSGILPYHVSTEVLESHPLPNLDKIKAAGSYNIKTLVDAAMDDLKLALQNGANMDYVAAVVGATLKLLEPLGEQAKIEFYCIHGLKLRDNFRRSGHEYKGGAQVLIDDEQVSVLKGRFISTTPTENGVQLKYQDVVTGKEENHPLSFKAIINCSGSDNLNESSSRLLRNMVNNNVCTMNLSGKGIEVNEKFEAAPNLYVMGPLLGGNVNKLIHFWQLENASRLTYLAPYLAKELITV